MFLILWGTANLTLGAARVSSETATDFTYIGIPLGIGLIVLGIINMRANQ